MLAFASFLAAGTARPCGWDNVARVAVNAPLQVTIVPSVVIIAFDVYFAAD